MEHHALLQSEAIIEHFAADAGAGATHVRYEYRRLTVLLGREGWQVNAKRVYRLYDEEGLKVRSVKRNKISCRQRIPHRPASGPNQWWATDFVSDKLRMDDPFVF